MKDINNEVENNLKSNELNKSMDDKQTHEQTNNDRISREHRAKLAAQAREQCYHQIKTQNETEETQDIESQTNPQTGKNKTTKRIILIIVALVVVGCSILFAFYLKKDNGNIKKVDANVKASKLATENNGAKKTQELTKSNNSNKAFKDPTIIEIDSNKWYLTCVNRERGVKDTFKPRLKKLTISPNDPRQTEKSKSQSMDYRAANQFQKMYNAAAKEGIYLTPYSGYRSIEFQKSIFENYVKINQDKGYSLDEAKFKASEIVLLPGTSEHNIGLAIDIVNTNKNFEDSKEFQWLEKNAQDYGFILRYLKDKTDVTNITYEPWHWRYVGVTDAKKIKDQGCSLEEYLNIK